MKRALLALCLLLGTVGLFSQSPCEPDNIPPTIVGCPGDQTPTDIDCFFELPDYTAQLTLSDNCTATAELEVVQEPEAGTQINTSTEITITVTDNAGLVSTCTFTVNVEDTEPPVAQCKTTTVQLEANGTATLVPTAINDNSYDNCPTVYLSASPNTFDCTQVGPQTVTLTVMDVAGQTDDCTVEITVVGIVAIDEVIATDESCQNANDGKIEIAAMGPGTLEYSIDGGDSFQDEPVFPALADAEYDIVVRDKTNNDCLATTTATVAPGVVCRIEAADPCLCLNNASPYDMDTDTGGGDGQFSELVTIAADEPLPEGLIFKLIAPTTGVYDVYDLPVAGQQSAGVPAPTDGSVTFTFNDGIYELPFVHNDGEGYNMTVILEVEGVNAIGFQLSNTCFYPQPLIESDLNGPFCSLSQPVELIGSAGGVEGSGTFYINGEEITTFDPALYDPGNYTISYVFDAGPALGYMLENGIVIGPPSGASTLDEAEEDPGCQASAIKNIEIIPKPEGYACREQVNVNLQEDCRATLTPEQLVGDLECVDLSGLFTIRVEDDFIKNGAMVDGCGTYRYTITGPDGFDCWGYVTAEDKTPPTLLYCPETVSGIDKDYGFQSFVCEDLGALLLSGQASYTSDKEGAINYGAIPANVKAILDLTGYALFEDNCGDLTITVSDELLYGNDPDCDEVKILRTFTAIDACQGLLSPEVCYQEIVISKPDLEDVFCPEDAELDCADDFKVDTNGNPHPDVTGYPWLYTAFDLTDDDIENYQAFLDQNFCNLGASYIDGPRIEVCPGTYKIVRTWEILDWCSKEVFVCQQIIKVGDEEAPVASCPEVDYDNDGQADLHSYSTGPYDCTAAFQVPLPEVTDNCTDWEVLTEIIGLSTTGPVIASIPHGSSRFVSGIPLGCHFFRYTVTDLCGNETVIYCPFVVEDRVAPIAVCNDDLNVSIGGQGLARIYATDLDEGSSDNCGPIRVEVRRRILAGQDYACLDQFDYDQDGNVIGDEVKKSTQLGDPDGTGAGQEYYYTPWLEYVDFTCCDVGEAVRVELRVWDDRNGDGLPGNTIEKYFCSDDEQAVDITDNSNACWMDLTIEDKLPAYCVPPLPASIDCDKLPFDFDPTNSEQMTELFGAASGTDNCPGHTVVELLPDTTGLDDCGFGTLVRRFQVADARGLLSTNNCEQTVTINERHHYRIKFPKDAEANCGIPQADTVEVEELACDLLAVGVKEDFFSASGDECYKIFRTYSVINWCEYDGISDPVVVSRDEDCDGEPGDEDVWVIVKTVKKEDPCADYYGNEPKPYYSHVWYDRDRRPNNLNPEAGEKGLNCDYETNPYGFWKEVAPITESEESDTDNYPDGYDGDHCQNMASVGYWQYTQIIKVYDDVNPVVEFTAFDPFCSYSNDVDSDCPAEVLIDFTVNENCTPQDLTLTIYLDAYQDGIIDQDVTALLSGSYPNYRITGTFPLGAHYLGVSVKDGCGNQVGVNIPFEVIDCKAPAPICINGLAVELMPMIPPADADGDGDIDYGAIDIWASDFIASPNVDCTGEVTYSINRLGEDADPDQTGITLTCDDDASQLIEVWAWDGAGNGDFCETYVLVQDNMINCETAGNIGSIAGTIADEKLKPISGVNVELSGNSVQNMATPPNGHYVFSELERGFDYTVTPVLDVQPLNGISTFDLVLLSKHILDVQPLKSPYLVIAADVNRSKTITTLDAIQLRRLILNIDTRFGNNTSWRFIPTEYTFPDPANPWLTTFPEVLNINNLQGDLTDQDFVAIKVGDLNSSAVTSALDLQPRNVVGQFLIEVPEQELEAGQLYRLDFTSAQLQDVQGYQFTLMLDPEVLQIEDIDYGVAQAANFGLRFLEEGLLTTSWNTSGSGMERFGESERLFSLIVSARQNTPLSDVLHISNRLTIAEAYDEADQLLDVGIDFGIDQVQTAGFELYQNAPNPFREKTQIGFYLPTEEQVSIRIYDASGRTLKLIRGQYQAGLHQVQLNHQELGAAGLLYYSLVAGEYTATRKMVLLD